MQRLMGVLRRFCARDDGPTTTEYAVILALIVAAALVAVRSLGGGVEGKWQRNANEIITAIGD